MNESNLGSIGEQIDEFLAHLIERHDRLASDVSRNNARIEARMAVVTMVASIVTIAAIISTIVFVLAAI